MLSAKKRAGLPALFLFSYSSLLCELNDVSCSDACALREERSNHLYRVVYCGVGQCLRTGQVSVLSHFVDGVVIQSLL